MSEVVAIVEGQTEQTFVRDQLAAHLGSRGTTIWAVLPGRTRRQGGVKEWPIARADIIRTLHEGRYCTTMFDYYAMPASWPGRSASKALPWRERATHVEDAVLENIAAAMGGSFNPAQFIPYVQLHEFEALAFADIQTLAEVTAPLIAAQLVAPLAQHYQSVLDEVGHPEAINDSYETCPSRRITARVAAYRKRVHGPIVTRRIGLDILRARCDHFAAWLTKLEAL